MCSVEQNKKLNCNFRNCIFLKFNLEENCMPPVLSESRNKVTSTLPFRHRSGQAVCKYSATEHYIRPGDDLFLHTQKRTPYDVHY